MHPNSWIMDIAHVSP